FYQRLCQIDPALRRLFRGDMREQGRKLMATIGMVVSSLDRLGELLPAVQDLGRRHAGYGVRDGHYDTGGGALLSPPRTKVGDSLSREAEEAWAIAYATLTGVMKAAAAEVAVQGTRGEAAGDARQLASSV